MYKCLQEQLWRRWLKLSKLIMGFHSVLEQLMVRIFQSYLLKNAQQIIITEKGDIQSSYKGR